MDFEVCPDTKRRLCLLIFGIVSLPLSVSVPFFVLAVCFVDVWFFSLSHHQCGVVGVRQLSTTHAARGLEEFFPAGPANEHADAGERQFILVSVVCCCFSK